MAMVGSEGIKLKGRIPTSESIKKIAPTDRNICDILFSSRRISSLRLCQIDYVITLNWPIIDCPYTNPPTQNLNSPTAWLEGATKAEAAATRREKRKKERILIVFWRGVRKRIVLWPWWAARASS